MSEKYPWSTVLLIALLVLGALALFTVWAAPNWLFGGLMALDALAFVARK